MIRLSLQMDQSLTIAGKHKPVKRKQYNGKCPPPMCSLCLPSDISAAHAESKCSQPLMSYMVWSTFTLGHASLFQQAILHFLFLAWLFLCFLNSECPSSTHLKFPIKAAQSPEGESRVWQTTVRGSKLTWRTELSWPTRPVNENKGMQIGADYYKNTAKSLHGT